MEKSEYHRYLASREWAVLKEKVKERSKGRCERCLVRDHSATHHVTYERIGHERMEDLLGVCSECHKYLSGKVDIDPAKDLAESIAKGIDALSFLFNNTYMLCITLRAIEREDLADKLEQMCAVWDNGLADEIPDLFADLLAEHIEFYREARETERYYEELERKKKK